MLRDFRSHVDGGPFNRKVINSFMIGKYLGKSEVCNFNISIVNQDVFRFNISMHHEMVVQDLIALAELLKEEPDFLFRNVVFAIE